MKFLSKITILSLGIAAVFASCNGNQNESKKADSPITNSEHTFLLENGVNVSHWLSQSPLRGEERRNLITKKDFDSIAAMGFDHVRIPIDEEQMYDENMNRQEEAFALLNNAIQWSIENNLRVIVDLHIVRSYHFNNENEATNSLFENRSAQEKVFSIWSDLQKELKKYSTDSVAYEFLNEPKAPTCQQWNELIGEFIDRIRKEEPNRYLVIGSNWWNSPGTIDSLSIPENEKKVILSFHFYTPALITHYRAPWNNETNFYTDKVDYPGQIIKDTSCFEKYTEEQRIKLRRQNFNAEIDSLYPLIAKLTKFTDSLGVQLNCGEFGAYPYFIDKEIRLRWYEDMVGTFNKFNISATHWCYKGDFPVVNEDGSANELPAILLKD